MLLRRRVEKHIKCVPVCWKWRLIYLFQRHMHVVSLRSFTSEIFITPIMSKVEALKQATSNIYRLVCHDFGEHEPAVSIWKKVRHQWKTSREVKLFMYDNNDVIRKKIVLNIFSSSSLKNVFAFSSWFYLILILWFFSDHIQIGIRRERWCRNEQNIFELKYSWWWVCRRDASLDAVSNMSTQSRISILFGNCDWYA